MEQINDLISSQTNFRFSPTKNKNITFRTAKLFYNHPHLSSNNSMTDIRQGFKFKLKTTRSLFPKLNKQIKPKKYENEYLKNDLITFRSEIHTRKNELHLLKIKYNKLLLDNINNKTLLAKILDIPLNKLITKNMVYSKIKNCKLNPEEKIILKQAHEILKLKIDIDDKKKLLEQKITFKNDLEKNAKRKIVSNLENEYFIKCEQQRSLLKTLEKLEKRYNNCERKTYEVNEKLKKEKENNEKKTDEEVEKMDCIQKMFDEKVSIIKQINQLSDKINKLEKINSDKEKLIKESEKNNNYDEQNLNIINNYKKILSEDLERIKQKTKSKEELEAILKNYDNEIKSLQEQLDNLNTKMYKYREEKPKLIRKANEPRKDIEKMESLKKELEELKMKKEKTEEKHNQKQKDLKEINEQGNTDNEKYKNIIEENNKQKDELNKKIDILTTKLNELNTTNIGVLNNFNKEKNEFSELEQNLISIKKQIEESNLEDKENKEKIEEEKKKEQIKIDKTRKREIDKLKKEINKYTNDNRILEEQNKTIQEELDGYNISLEQFDQIQTNLNEALNRLNNLKKK